MEFRKVPAEPPARATSRARRHNLSTRIGLWLIAAVGLLLLSLFVVSFFLDGIIRPRIEESMNRALKGYHLALGHAHLQLLGLRLTLKHLIIVQEAHPAPPVAEIPAMRFRIYWREILSGHVVANVGISNPTVHIDRPQFSAERRDKTPLRERGWQDALQNAYPFKINRLAIIDGDITYIDAPGAKPLHLTRLDFVSDNIRNIQEPRSVYPSRFRAEMALFDKGSLRLDGRANYLMKPFPGMVASYAIKGVPLNALTPAIRHINLMLNGGSFSSHGSVEYSPTVTNVDVRNATINSVDLTYVHLRQTQSAEKQRIAKAGRAIERENNRPSVNIQIHELDLHDSRLAFNEEVSDPGYTLFITGTDLRLTNLSNHGANGQSHLTIRGKFMGSGVIRVNGTFIAGGAGPEFATDVQIVNTDLTALNPLMRAYGRFDVAQGVLTVYAQLGLHNSNITGYVKPMFSNVKVYDYDKDKNRNLLQQAKEVVIGAAAHIFKNRQTQKVATQVNLTGTLKNPNVSSWQAFVEVVRNAFIQAILPGFDRQTHIQGANMGKEPEG